MRWWWDNTIIPLEDSFADEIETQMFPAFGLDAAEYRIAWDRSRIPALQEDESAKHAMWREDYRAGGIDRYTYLTKIGEQADEKLKGVLHPSATPKSGEGGTALKIWDESKHPRGGNPKNPGEFRTTGAFESMFVWSGDALPTKESKEFQDAKVAAVEKLKPNTLPGAVESSIVVIKGSGIEHSHLFGTQENVPFRYPVDEVVAFLHAHSKHYPHSPEDLTSIFTRPNIDQSHIVTPRGVISIHKPLDWSAREYKFQEGRGKDKWQENFSRIKREWDYLKLEFDGELDEHGILTFNEQRTQEKIITKMTKDYGLLYRIGELKMDDAKSLPDNSSIELGGDIAINALNTSAGAVGELDSSGEEIDPAGWSKEHFKERAALITAVLNLSADAVERAERLGTEVEPVKMPTYEELQVLRANFTDEDWRNFLAMGSTGASPETNYWDIPTVEEWENATGRKTRVKIV